MRFSDLPIELGEIKAEAGFKESALSEKVRNDYIYFRSKCMSLPPSELFAEAAKISVFGDLAFLVQRFENTETGENKLLTPEAADKILERTKEQGETLEYLYNAAIGTQKFWSGVWDKEIRAMQDGVFRMLLTEKKKGNLTKNECDNRIKK